MKKFLIILGVLLVVGAIAAVVLLASLGSIVKAGVNNVGPRITGTKVELKEAKISVFSGEGTLKELTVGNPAGWQTAHAFFLKEISISMDPKSVKGDHIVINSILIDQPEITYETVTLTTSNLQDLLANVQKAAGGSATEAPAQQPAQPATTGPQAQTPAQPQAPSGSGSQVKIEIKSFVLKNVTVNVNAAGKAYTVTLPELTMENLGTREGGLTPEQLTYAVIKDVTAQAVKAGVNAAAKKGLLDKAGEGLRNLIGGKK